jgi:hypothetical protein
MLHWLGWKIMMLHFTIPPAYRSQSADKTPEADYAYFFFLRQASLPKRIGMTRSLIRMSRKLAIDCAQRQQPNGSEAVIRMVAAPIILQDKYTHAFVPLGDLMTWQQQDSIQLTQFLHPLLEQLGIPYYLGGGLAAAVWGEPRVTQDADLILQLPSDRLIEQFDQLIALLEDIGFYCPPGAVEGVKLGIEKTVSVTHMETVDNADLIAMPDTPFERSQMARRVLIDTLGNPFWVCTAEDVVLQKLVYSHSSRSEKQWRQILGVLKVQQAQVDRQYLNDWAIHLGVIDRLRQAYEAAGL